MNQHADQGSRDDGPADEPRAWREALTRWLIHRAARGAPAPLAERLEEEWLADLASRPSAWSRLRLALGCCWATRVIAQEHAAAQVALTGGALGGKFAIGFPHEHSDRFSRRSMTMALVIAVHIAVFYWLMTGVGLQLKKMVPSSLQTRILPAAHSLPPIAMPPPAWVNQKIVVPPPEYPSAGEANEAHVMGQPMAPPPAGPAVPAHEVSRVSGGPGSGFPTAEDYYPSAAIRLREQGVATVRVCVDEHGRLLSDPSTVQSSGSPRLDQGALALAKAGSGHYRASTEDGRAVSSCYAFKVRFQLRN